MGTGDLNQDDYLNSPQILLKAQLPEVSFNMSPDIYNSLVNIKYVLQSVGVEDELIQLKAETDRIANES